MRLLILFTMLAMGFTSCIRNAFAEPMTKLDSMVFEKVSAYCAEYSETKSETRREFILVRAQELLDLHAEYFEQYEIQVDEFCNL